MEKHYQLSDSEFEQQFSTLTLDPEIFSHEAHLRLAWIYISKYGVEEALDRVGSQIHTFASHHGDSKKFHVTVTGAAVRAVYHFMLKSRSNSFAGFIAEFPQLKTSFRDLLDSHYSVDIFKSEKARKEWLDPDIEPFD